MKIQRLFIAVTAGLLFPYVSTLLTSSSPSTSPSRTHLSLASLSSSISFTRFLPHSASRTRGAIQYYLQQHYNVSCPAQIVQHNAFAATLTYELPFTAIEWEYLTVRLQLHVEETCTEGCFVRVQVEPAWTEWWVRKALRDIECGLLATPRLLRRQMIFSIHNSTQYNTTIAATNATAFMWRDFCWNQGGGLPLPLPPFVGKETRIILPPGLVERIRSIKTKEVYYQVDNPGWLSLYPVYTHIGRVRFLPRRTNLRNALPDTILLDWQVQVRPYPETRRIVEWFTETIVVTLTRNLYVHCTEPESVINVWAPIGRPGAFWTLRKDSWFGGVWEARRTDQRAPWRQIIDLGRPWTWGRSHDLSQMNATTTWTDGYFHD
jgi:hypothetical protein